MRVLQPLRLRNAEESVASDGQVRPPREWALPFNLVVTAILLSLALCIAQFVLSQTIRTAYPARVKSVRAVLALRQAADSLEPMTAAYQIATEGGQVDVYQEVIRRLKTRFQYSSASLLPIWVWHAAVKLGLPRGLDLAACFKILSLISLAIVVLGTARLTVDARTLEGPARWLWAGAGVVLAASFYPLLQGFRVGNIQLLLNAIIVLMILAWRPDTRGFCGMLAGVLCVYKPHYAILLAWALVCREYRFAKYLAGTVAGLIVVSIPLFGAKIYADFLSFLVSMGSRGHAYGPNQSPNGFLNRFRQDGSWFQVDPLNFARYDPVVAAFTTIVGAALIGGMLYWCWKQRRPASRLSMAIALVSIILAAPVAWEHHFGFLPAVFALILPYVRTRLQGSLWVGAYVLGADEFHLSGSTSLWNNLLYSTLLLGTVLLLGLLYRAARPLGANGQSGRPVAPELVSSHLETVQNNFLASGSDAETSDVPQSTR